MQKTAKELEEMTGRLTAVFISWAAVLMQDISMS